MGRKSKRVKLSKLLKTVRTKRAISGSDPEIGSIHYRAQDVKAGGLFVAIPGHTADGHDFIDKALARGASAIVTQKPVNQDSIIVENSRNALAAISARFFGNPSEKLFIIGITGTNGKTTTAFLIESILAKAGFSVGVIGTINYRYLGKTFKSPMTTPESLDLQKMLARMQEHGITHVVMEVSSHAIDLQRIDCCRLDVGVFTNLSQDHLDYHKDMNSYWSCKKRLFTENLSSGPKKGRTLAVINCDDARGKELALELKAQSSKPKVFELSDNMIRPSNIKYESTGITGRISTNEGSFDFRSHLVGEHNLKNILCATCVGIALGLPIPIIKAGIEEVSSVPGRLERIPDDMGRFVYVDYAHTPDALEHALSSLRSVARGRIVCVFGCGGDRDKDKRPKMGETVGRLCDLAIITSDNPRTEAPMEIINQVLEGTKKASRRDYTSSDPATGFNEKGYVIEPDRKNAIYLGITASRPGDTVLIAGKGHETYQIIGNKSIPFDDRQEAIRALSEVKAQSNRKSEIPNPMPWTAAEILEATKGDLLCGDIKHIFSGISIDSRKISTDDLFIAIKGNVYDGHSFASDVIGQGVHGLIISKNKTGDLPGTKWQKNGIVCVAVDNTTKALGDLASFNRKRSNVSVVAITGSNGKTTTRGMTSAVVARRFCTLSTSGNFNNEIGLPLTLLRLGYRHEWAVLELGMNRPGEIGRLAEICLPDIGVITNIGPAHLEGLGSIEGVMHAKSELLEKIKPNGTAVLNADDPKVLQIAHKTGKNVLLFGLSKDAMISAVDIKKKGVGISFTLILPEQSISVELGIPGNFMVSNALAAASVGYLLGLSPAEIKDGLENFKAAKGRMNILKTSRGIHIIDDTYNANPDSMEAAIKTLMSLKGDKRGVFVAGDMFELGKHAEYMHKKLGMLSARSGIAKLYVTGKFAERVASGALDEGMGSRDIFTGSKEEIVKDLKEMLRPGDWILVKGSRTTCMEKVVEGLKKGIEELRN